MQDVDVGDTTGEVMIKGAFFIHDDDLKNFQMDVIMRFDNNLDSLSR